MADLYFDDADHMKRVMDTPEAKATVADLGNFATGGVTVLISEVSSAALSLRPDYRDERAGQSAGQSAR